MAPTAPRTHPVHRLLPAAMGVDLVVAAAFLGAWKLGWIPVDPDHPEGPFLLFVNGNMLLCAAAAVLAAAVGWRRAAARREGAAAAGLLLLALGLLTAGEVLCAALEFADRPPSWLERVADGSWLASRLAIAVWLVHVVRRRPAVGGRLPRGLAPVALAAIGPLGVFALLRPLLAGGEPVAAAMVTLDLLALLALALAVPRLPHIRVAPAVTWPAIGLGLYLLVDLVQYRYVAVGDPGFCLGELVYFEGYLAVALGAWRAGEPPWGRHDRA